MSRILLNGLHYEKNGAGISRYNQMLIKTFIKEDFDVDILIRNQYKNEFISNGIILSDNIINESKDRILYEQIKAMGLYKNYDIVHFPDYATPVFYNKSKVATIHDMGMLTMRDKRTLGQNITKNILLKNTIKHADKLICVSEFAKKELLKYYPNVENKVQVIYEGIDYNPINYTLENEQNVLDKYNLRKDKYILFVGTIAPHKNIKKLIQAFAYISKKIPEYKLVIAGKKGWMYDEVFIEVENLKIGNKVIFTDKIDQVELEILYKNASIFTSVSLYEGFGFPPLEAMIRSVPVLVSDIEIFREICGDCAIYCNPNEIEDIGEKIIKIINDDKLQQRLIDKALQRVKIFNWEVTAKKTYDVYRSLL